MTPTRQPLVLIVDDMVETRRLMRRLLERERMRVAEAESGAIALREIANRRPDVVILDLRMPGMSGFEVARTIREHPDRTIASTPLLACSASVHAEVRLEALDAGCDAFLGKPFDVATFSSTIRALAAQREPG